jgi:tRNA(Ile2) C34 agmatinyltransferase TiaS
MIYEYECSNCGVMELPRYGIQQCPKCSSKLRRIYKYLDVQVRRGWTDVPPEARYENWLPEERRATIERGE